jgi:fatty-acyl-CoA synthase
MFSAMPARVVGEATALADCVRSGLIGWEPPRRIVPIARAISRFGLLFGAVTTAAIRHPDRIGLVDERGSLTYRELDERSNALANAWLERGLRAGDSVAILARNHRGFLEATVAAGKGGARIVLLNTDFAGPQLRQVSEREGTDLLVHDEEFGALTAGLDPRLGRWRAWAERPGEDTLEALIARGDRSTPPKPERAPKLVVLTSGTTGTPKGAPRGEPRSLIPVGGLLSKVPFRAGETTECCVPMFHSLGFAHALLAFTFGSTLIVRRRFDPAATLESLRRHRASAMIVVPVMLRRLLDHGPVDVPAPRIIFVAGSQLGAALCTRALEAFGPVVYNLYGSTEVAYATIATPADLRIEPGCVGGVVRGATVRILDQHGTELPPGQPGRIFVGNSFQFEGYTGGGTKETNRGLMASGDVGHFDAAHRLFIDGRDDEMIVSGGENLFPAEVEELLERHPDIVEAAAIGVPDPEFGQRLRAYVVAEDGAVLTERDVQDHVRANLARFKIPREIVFLRELPRNPTGKVLTRQLG